MAILITVRDRAAKPEPGAAIVCGNSGNTVQFDFDADWDAYGAVTGARDDDISALTHGLAFGLGSNTYGSSESSGENQTVLCPTPTHSKPGETSIIEGVFMMPWAQYRNEGKIQIGNKHYASNGYWVLED